MLQSVFPTFGERKFTVMVGLFFKLERGIGLLGFSGGKIGFWISNPNVSLFNDYSLINDYLSLKKYKLKILTWKIVGVSKASVLFIYIDYKIRV